MVILVLYDISGSSKRLNSVRKICERWGTRIQKSAYECNLDYTQYKSLLEELDLAIDHNKDSILLYIYGNNDDKKCKHLGKVDNFEEQRTCYVI